MEEPHFGSCIQTALPSLCCVNFFNPALCVDHFDSIKYSLGDACVPEQCWSFYYILF